MTKLITVSFFSKDNMTGGSERFFDQFKELGETIHVDTFRMHKVMYGIVTKEQEAALNYHSFETEVGIGIDKYILELEDLYKPDVIIKNSWTGTFLKPKTPVISVFQDVHHTAADILFNERLYGTIDYNRVKYVFIEMQRKVAEQSVLKVAVSEFVKERMKEIGITCDKVIYHGIDLAHFRHIDGVKEQMRKKYNIPLDKKVGLWIGRMHPQKGWHIMSQLIKNFPDIFWVCVFMEPIKHGPQLKNVLCLKPVPYMEMEFLYNLADFFILPSCCESFGLSSIEAAACGLPVVTGRTGIWADLKDKGNDAGIIVDNWNYESYQNAVLDTLYLLDKFNPRKVAELFPLETWKKNWSETINEVIKK